MNKEKIPDLETIKYFSNGISESNETKMNCLSEEIEFGKHSRDFVLVYRCGYLFTKKNVIDVNPWNMRHKTILRDTPFL